MLVSKLGTEYHRGSDPMVPGDVMLGIFRLEAGSLPFKIIEQFISHDDCVVFSDLPANVVDSGIFGRETSKLSGGIAHCTI